MSVLKMNVKDIDWYWERLSYDLSFVFHYLKGKAEYGSCASESGVQRIVLYTALNIAEEDNMNVNMVSSLCQAVALCFPKRGLAELSFIKEFIKRNDLELALDTLEIDAIEYAVYENGIIVTPELNDLLHKYYSNDESVVEVNLVRFLQKYLNMNRNLLLECSFANAGQVVDEIMKRAKEEFEISYRLLPDVITSSIPQGIKEEIEKDISINIEFFDDINVAIYNVIV